MKYIKQAPETIAPLWWVDRVAACPHCAAEIQLEFDDQDRMCYPEGREEIAVFNCPACYRPVMIFQSERVAIGHAFHGMH